MMNWQSVMYSVFSNARYDSMEEAERITVYKYLECGMKFPEPGTAQCAMYP